jgi:hypothetical protein
MESLICEKIAVECEGIPAQPVSFVWRKREYQVVAVKQSWHDWGFARSAPTRDWRSRRHRTYYRVETGEGTVFELYLDRANRSGPAWILHKMLTG